MELDKQQALVDSDLEADNPMLLKLFYRHFFPYKQYYQWLNYDTTPVPSKTFLNREFCFTLVNDTYIRFQSFKNVENLKQELTRLNPVKIDLGAIYNIRPEEKKRVRPGAFVPVAKELVFDIDMTDYDEIRTCCSGGDVCTKCWEYMSVAMKVIHAALTLDFGFKHLLWVYSGRRGVHCWIADERARKLNNEQRKAIVSYIEVIKGGAQQGRKVKLPSTLHPSLSRSFEVVSSHFPSLVFDNQDVLTEPDQWEKIIALIPDDGVQARLRELWADTPGRSPSLKWGDVKSEIEEAIAQSPKKRAVLENIRRDIMFQYTYPRLDEKVSTNINHLLKSPFCVHPKTGRVCVPIAIEASDEFDPSTPPTVPQLIRELNEYDATHPTENQDEQSATKLSEWEKTSLKPYVLIFENFIKGIMKELRERNREAASKSLNF